MSIFKAPFFQSPIDFCSRSRFDPHRVAEGEIEIRPLRKNDSGLAQAFVQSMSATARYMRFFQVMSQLSPSLLERFVSVDGERHIALAAVTSQNGISTMIGEARFIVKEIGHTADIAIAVSDRWQRRGLARDLLGQLEAKADSMGVQYFKGEMLPQNEAMLGLVRACGYRVWQSASDCHVLQLSKRISL